MGDITGSLCGMQHASVQAKLLLGVYTLQANRAVFNQNQVDPTCHLCASGPEDRLHFVLQFPTLSTVRETVLSDIRNLVPGLSGCYSQQSQMQMILDHRSHNLDMNDRERVCLDILSNKLFFKLHTARLHTINTSS